MTESTHNAIPYTRIPDLFLYISQTSTMIYMYGRATSQPAWEDGTNVVSPPIGCDLLKYT